MAELMKLLEHNGAFKSELMQNLLSSTLTGASIQSTQLSSSNFSSLQGSTADACDNKAFIDPRENLNGNTIFTSSTVSTNTNENLQRPRIVNLNAITSSSLSESNKNNVTLQDSQSNANNNANANVGAAVDAMGNLILNANGRQLTHTTQARTEPSGARPVAPDTNANHVIDVAKILSEVQERPSEARQLLAAQVTSTIMEAHISTTINTHANVAAATERIQREANEMPDNSQSPKNGANLWQYFMAAMVPEITKVINFSKKLPGFSEVELSDRIQLIKQGCFELMVTRFCLLVDHEKEEILDPTLKMKAPRSMVQEMPMGPFLDKFFDVASQFNPLRLTDGEVALFTAVLMFCPERTGLNNVIAVKALQKLFIQALYFLLKENHTDADGTLKALLNMVPIFHKINEAHLMFIKMIKMKSPADYEKKFPPLHKELFDSSC